MKFSARNSGLIIVILALYGCDFIQMKKEDNSSAETQSIPIARAKDNFLYPEDLTGIVSSDITPEDSANLVERYINNWAKKQLLIAEASSKIEFNEAELQRKILDYRYALMVYEYEKQYVNGQLNKEVSDEEIQAYYEQNTDKFELKQNITRGIFVKISKEAPQLSRLPLLIRSSKVEDEEELKSYCLRFAASYSLEDSTWINFDEIIKNTPLTAITNKVDFLKRNKYVESDDEQFQYYLRIDEYKISDQISPLEFVEDQIRSIIVNKRKVELVDELEKEVFNKAISNNDFEIYSN